MSNITKVVSKVRQIFNLPNQIRELQDLILFHQTKFLQFNNPNPLNRFGKKCFSKADQDGITLEILRRIKKLDMGVYAELGDGVGDGTENNTLILAALGWKGVWIGGNDLKFDIENRDRKKLYYLKERITLENLTSLTKKGLKEIDLEELDVISLVDGNNIYFAEELLAHNFRPKLFIVEYNAKFPPPVEFQIAYDSKFTWKHDDYFCASLSSFSKLFNKFNYRLICCNSQSGINAFFIDASYSEFFSDVPTDIGQIYVEPRYYAYNKYGHNKSMQTIKNIINANGRSR